MMTGASAPQSGPVRAASEQPGVAAGRSPRRSPRRSPGVVLIGFMGAGKSRVGRELARLLQVKFVDTDKLIERQYGPIATIFSERAPFLMNKSRYPSLATQKATYASLRPVIAVSAIHRGRNRRRLTR